MPYRRPGGPAGGRPLRPGPQAFEPDLRPARPAVPDAMQLAPGEELVAGRRPVEEAFAARRPALRLLVTPGRRQALERLVLHATTLRIPIVEVEGGSITALAGFDGHQGIALVVEPRRFATPDEVLARAIERGEPPFILVLDSLEDPQNLGTVLRSAEAAGVHGVLFPTERQAPLSPAAVKASAGATEHLLLCPVDDLAGTLTDLHVRGVRVVGSEADAPLTARQSDLRGPLAIVVGSEGHGLSPAVRRRCDLMVRIPMRGAIGSLNAAVAGSVLLFEALGQRDPDARPAPATTVVLPAPVPRRTPVSAAAQAESATTAAPPTDATGPAGAAGTLAAADADEAPDATGPGASGRTRPGRRARPAGAPKAAGRVEPVVRPAPEPATAEDAATRRPARARRVAPTLATAPSAEPEALADALLPAEPVAAAASPKPDSEPAAADDAVTDAPPDAPGPAARRKTRGTGAA